MTADGKAAVAGAGAGGQPSQPVTELKKLGKYQIEKRIGAGGMGTVYLARDTQLKRIVALKVLPQDKAQNPTLVKRFKAEAQAAAQLRHNNIVGVYDTGEDDGYLFIAMEYVEGQDLFELVQKRGIIPVKRSIEIIKQVAAALQHAFEQNIVHRDIKPSNLLIRRDGVVKLTDLGLARSIDDTLETNITRAGTTVGTVDYMSPEQARNSKAADIRSDLYSLGCTWYQMLTGEPPFPEGSMTNKLQAHAIKPAPDPRDKNPNVPEGLTAVIQRMMAKKPEDRYQTPADLLEDLARLSLSTANISREIFGDLSDYDQKTVGHGGKQSSSDDEDADEEDDGYYDDEKYSAQKTPDEVPTPSQRKPKNAARDTGDQNHAETRSTPRSRPRQDDPDSDEVENDKVEAAPVRRKKPKAAQNDSDDSDSRRGTVRARAARDVDDDESADSEPARQKRPKVVDDESGSNRSSSKPKSGRESKPDSRPAEDSSGKSKSHKPLPPKRDAAPVAVDADRKGINAETIKYLGIICGVIVVVAGVGYLIAAFSGGIGSESNPYAAPAPGQSKAEQLAAASGQLDPNANKKTEPEAPVTVTPTPPKPAAPQPDFDVEALPQWAAKDVEPSSTTVLTVGPGAKTATHFASLDDVLPTIPDAGGIVKLLGAGPFPMTYFETARLKRLVLMAASVAERPVILIKSSDLAGTGGIKLSEGQLEVRGVHFVLDRNQFPNGAKMLEVVDGGLLVHQSSFTANGPDTVATTAIVVSSTYDNSSAWRIPPNVLLDQVTVRGDGLKGLAIQRANVDAVVRDSLLATGSAAAIEFTGFLTPGVADVVTHKPRRIVRLIRSTVFSRRSVFDASSSTDAGGKPPRTDIVILDSLCCAQGATENSALLLAARWPQVSSTTESWLTRMKWVSRGSLYLGFEQLVDLGPSLFKVNDATQWQRVWSAKYDTRQFHKLSFPDDDPSDLSTLSPLVFDVSALTYREVKAGNGDLPGCPVSKLMVPDAALQQRGAVLALRPQIPASILKPVEAASTRKVDLKKQDLGLILTNTEWPSGTLFEASGGGLCQMSPAKIDGKSLRIVFRQTDGLPLKLQPKTGEGKAPDAAALFSITRGTLELTNAVLEGSLTPKLSTPPWLIQSTDATVVLNGCRLHGSEVDGQHQQGLIRFTTSAQPSALPEPPLLFCRDSYLTGFCCGIRVEAGSGNVVLRNSIFAMRGDALDLRPMRVGNELPTLIDADHVTFSASGAVVRVEAASGNEGPVTSPMRLFLDNCAIAPPLTFKQGEADGATLLKCVGPVLEQKQLDWWGLSNGVAKEVVRFLHREPESPDAAAQSGLAAWRRTWGKSNDIKLLTGDRGVYLVRVLPNKWKDLRPTSFELDKSAQATTWAAGGKPIGANLRSVEDSSVAKKAGAEPAVSKPATAGTKPAPTAPATKKNVGF